ncbi:MAG: hypothetical protein ABJZ18_01485, partial [Algibacter sp.]
MILKGILILILAALLIKILIIKSTNNELINLWVSENYSTKNMFGISNTEKKTISLIKKLVIFFFIIFGILF